MPHPAQHRARPSARAQPPFPQALDRTGWGIALQSFSASLRLLRRCPSYPPRYFFAVVAGKFVVVGPASYRGVSSVLEVDPGGLLRLGKLIIWTWRCWVTERWVFRRTLLPPEELETGLISMVGSLAREVSEAPGR